jgi:ribosomal-protein-alanine N-acetyltransferase
MSALNLPVELRLAQPGDAAAIAAMSRDLVEEGLGWSWTRQRVARCIADPHTNVLTARHGGRLAGFGIMKYRDDEAHLLLFAVGRTARRRGVGSALMAWLEKTVVVAGIGVIQLETRARNRAARAFYASLGYHEVATVAGYYRGVESGIRLSKDLWA